MLIVRTEVMVNPSTELVITESIVYRSASKPLVDQIIDGSGLPKASQV